MNCNYGETNCEVFQADDQTNLLAHSWLPEKEIKAIFLAIHGGLAHAGDWVTPALYFKEKGIATFALDMRHHGTYDKYNKGSKVFFHIDSYDQYTEDIHKFYQWIKKKYPGKPIFILGHSNGSLIALYYGLTKGQTDDIKGYVLSSPWLKNIVSIPKIMLFMSKLIARVHPEFAVKPEPLTDHLTHDEKITARHYSDEKAGVRGTMVSAKAGVEIFKTQNWVLNNIKNWKKIPVFCIIAGKDKLADPQVSINAMNQIPKDLLQMIEYPENYHENFNEVNRDEIFARIYNWMQKYFK